MNNLGEAYPQSAHEEILITKTNTTSHLNTSTFWMHVFYLRTQFIKGQYIHKLPKF